MKSGVFKNYPTFIKFSEEIKKMDSTLEELQSSLDNTESLLVELKVFLDAAGRLLFPSTSI